MADKMMRIAGRGDDGSAKAIKTTDDGIIVVKNYTPIEYPVIISTADNIVVPANDNYRLCKISDPSAKEVCVSFNGTGLTVRIETDVRDISDFHPDHTVARLEPQNISDYRFSTGFIPILGKYTRIKLMNESDEAIELRSCSVAVKRG